MSPEVHPETPPPAVSPLRALVERSVAERLVLTIITFNLVVMFLRGFPAMDSWDGTLLLLDDFCLIFFVYEAGAKVRLRSWKQYWSVGMNRFDLAVVVLSLPTLIPNLGAHFEVFVLFRAARLLRFLRLLQFLPNADQLWAGISRALKASVGLILALALYDIVLGLVGNHLFHESAPKHFGNPLSSMYTVFKVFTIEGWYEVPEAIANGGGLQMALVAKGFFVFTVITGGLLGLSITNAVLVDEMVLDNNDELVEQFTELTRQVAQNETGSSERLERIETLLAQLVESRRPPDP